MGKRKKRLLRKTKILNKLNKPPVEYRYYSIETGCDLIGFISEEIETGLSRPVYIDDVLGLVRIHHPNRNGMIYNYQYDKLSGLLEAATGLPCVIVPVNKRQEFIRIARLDPDVLTIDRFVRSWMDDQQGNGYTIYQGTSSE